MHLRSLRATLAIVTAWLAMAGPLRAGVGAVKLSLEKGDHIAIIGNTLAERMQHHGWLETLFHARFPKHELSFRNLGFSGDELTLRLRSQGFGSPDEWLARAKADVVFAFFGYNESFGDQAGIDTFKNHLGDFIKHTLSQRYNGKNPPKLVLFSPIAHEDLHDRNLPDGTDNNRRIGTYAAAMADVAKAHSVAFVDLFTISRQIYAKANQPLTINGVHLNEQGDQLIAQAIDAELFLPPIQNRERAALEKLRSAVLDKNFYWFERYRTVDGYSIYGGRADLSFVDGQTNRVVMQREMEVLDVMTANRDRRVWSAAQGSDYHVDDGNAPPFLAVKTNKPGEGPNGTHLFASGQAEIERMTIAKGFKVNLFASEEMFPELAKPVQMAFDTKGRLWVACMPSYPHWKPGEEMNDLVLILDDADGDGRADKCTVFADKLHVPTGLEFYAGGLLVGQQPDLMYLKDTDGDDVADVRERVLHGIDSADTHHALNSFTIDPGGALYFQEGTFHHTQVETAYGPPQRCANAGVFRYEPRTQKFEVYVTYGFANPHGHVFDRWGQDLVTDGTGADTYFAAAFSGRLDFPQKHPGMQKIYPQWTRPCPATEIVSSRHFPDEMQGNLLVPNVIGYRGILQYKLNEKDSAFEGSEGERLLFSSDENFRPADLEFGPDGALYFTDWQNPIIGHMQHNLRDPSRDRTHGRVYRVTYEGRPLSKPAQIAGQPIERLLDLLKEPEARVRYRAKIELGGRASDDVVAALATWVSKLDRDDADYEHHLLEALWVYQYHNVVNQDLLKRMLRSPDDRARAAATRVLCYWRERVANPLALLRAQADDAYPRVRLEAVRACSFFDEARAAEVALLALKHPIDYYLSYTLGETMRQLQPHWKKAVQEGSALAADNPAGIDYLLQSVTTAELTKLPRTPLVYQALLSRDQVALEYRQEALHGLAKQNGTDVATELLAALSRIDQADVDQSDAILYDLGHLLTGLPSVDLRRLRDAVAKLAAQARRPYSRQIAYVALMTADGSLDSAWNVAVKSVPTLCDVLQAVPFVHDGKLRAAAYGRVRTLLFDLPPELAGKAAKAKGTLGRYVRVELPGNGRVLTLAEVEISCGGTNVAPAGKASQSSIGYGGEPKRAIDGNTSGAYSDGGQSHTNDESNPWWEVDLGQERPIDAITIWNRTEGNGQYAKRLDRFKLSVLDAGRQGVFVQTDIPAPTQKVRIELEGNPLDAVRRSAIVAVTSIEGYDAETIATLAGFFRDGVDREAAVGGLRRLRRGAWPKDEVRPMIENVLAYVRQVPTGERTSPGVVDALQLGKDLTSLLPMEEARAARAALAELGVPVFVIRPVPHKLAFDRTKIYVQSGKPVELVLDNSDIMPHNLIVAAPGALKEVGEAAEKMATHPDAFVRHFVPNVPQVLFATKMLPPRQVERLSFTAPDRPGDYPYLCTFPGHWRTMYGVLHVVSDLSTVPPEELLEEPAPLAEQRPFVRDWKYDELVGELGQIDRGRSFDKGKELFAAISCVACHKIKGAGGQTGPELVDLRKRFKREEILREMIEPSKVINEKFRTQIIETVDGEVVTGIVVSQNETSMRVMANPLEKCEPKVVRLDEIESRDFAKISMMPAGLLVTLTKEEILDLLAYVEHGGEPNAPCYKQ
jgi:putative heme-binding domain-containing protein